MGNAAIHGEVFVHGGLRRSRNGGRGISAVLRRKKEIFPKPLRCNFFP